MDDASIGFEPFVDAAVREFIVNGLDNHNMVATGMPGWFPANFVLRGVRGDVLGGLLAYIWGGWLHVGYLWMSEQVRGRGHAGRLMDAAEAYAGEHGCAGAQLETFSFQARPFYERRGYRLYATLEDCPLGHTKFSLAKRPL